MFTPSQLPGIGIDIEDLEAGQRQAQSPAAVETPAGPTRNLHPLVPGSVTAQALFQIWRGHRAVIVDSPPGAGKSRLVATVVAHLALRSGLRVVVATPTRRQAADIARSIAWQMDKPSSVSLAMSGLSNDEEWTIGDRGALETKFGASAAPKPGRIVVRTSASCVRSAPETDVLVIDEAYQATYSDVANASDQAMQLLLVGDPGQIGPVVTVNTTEWDRMERAPHRRAPEVVSTMPDVEILHLDKTYRFGPATVAAVADLYSFPFASARPPRSLGGLDELTARLVQTTGGADGDTVVGEVIDEVRSLIGLNLHADGEPDRPLEPRDLAVVAARNRQVAKLGAFLAGAGLDEVTVGTADKLQGGQWEAVVALDPLIDAVDGGVSDHALSLGRLCVMLSRHRAHLSWVHDGAWATALEGTSADAATARRHIKVRRHFAGSGLAADTRQATGVAC